LFNACFKFGVIAKTVFGSPKKMTMRKYKKTTARTTDLLGSGYKKTTARTTDLLDSGYRKQQQELKIS
jgi:hypothetical protein